MTSIAFLSSVNNFVMLLLFVWFSIFLLYVVFYNVVLMTIE